MELERLESLANVCAGFLERFAEDEYVQHIDNNKLFMARFVQLALELQSSASDLNLTSARGLTNEERALELLRAMEVACDADTGELDHLRTAHYQQRGTDDHGNDDDLSEGDAREMSVESLPPPATWHGSSSSSQSLPSSSSAASSSTYSGGDARHAASASTFSSSARPLTVNSDTLSDDDPVAAYRLTELQADAVEVEEPPLAVGGFAAGEPHHRDPMRICGVRSAHAHSRAFLSIHTHTNHRRSVQRHPARHHQSRNQALPP